VREAVIKRKEKQHVAWAYQRGTDYSNGRGFGFTGGHNHINWGSDNFRKLVLNGIIWTAKVRIPSEGASVTELTVPDLRKNQDYEPKGWTDAQIIDRLSTFNSK
jgi:type 1 glutamine amidotransferase